MLEGAKPCRSSKSLSPPFARFVCASRPDRDEGGGGGHPGRGDGTVPDPERASQGLLSENTMKTFLSNLLARKSSPKRRIGAGKARLQLEGLEERQVMSVTYHGGATLPNVEVQGVYYGDDWSDNSTLYSQTGHLEGFLGNIVQSPYMDMLNADYGVG